MRHPTAEDWDHARDLRKHEPRHTDPLPLHAQAAPLSTAMDIVLLVRGMSNLQAAADLVDTYADLKAAGTRLEQFEVPNV